MDNSIEYRRLFEVDLLTIKSWHERGGAWDLTRDREFVRPTREGKPAPWSEVSR